MRRTVAMVKDSSLPFPVLIDLFTVDGKKEHTFDLPFYYVGQFIHTNVKYIPQLQQQQALGSANGYQHLWKEAEGKASGMVQFSWLSGNRYYSVSSAADSQTSVLFARIGANDPDFNLRREPAVILRKKNSSAVFASVIEPHGIWDGTIEISRDASSSIRNISVVASDSSASIIRVERKNGSYWMILVWNGTPSESQHHSATVNNITYSWTGNIALQKYQ